MFLFIFPDLGVKVLVVLGLLVLGTRLVLVLGTGFVLVSCTSNFASVLVLFVVKCTSSEADFTSTFTG